MKKILLNLCLLATVSLALTSCEKDEDPKTNAELVLGTWTLTAATIDPPPFTTGPDLYATYEDCDKDDLLTFEDNNVVKLDEGTLKCNQSDPQTFVGTYAFNPDETILTHTVDGTTTSFTVSSLDASTMVLVETITLASVENTLTFTYSKQ